MSKKKIKSVLVFGDTHVKYGQGGLDPRAWRAIQSYAETKKWDEVVHLGDVADYGCISSHEKGVLRGIDSKLIGRDNDAVNDFLDQAQKMAPKAKFTIIEGNHDFRIERYLDFHPELGGLLDCEKAWNLKKRNIQWVPFWSRGDVYKIGKASFIHGIYTNKYHAEQHCRNFGGNVFSGHTHDVMCFSVQEIGELPKVGQSLGCLQVYDPKWLRGRPSRWQQAFAVFHFLPDGNFSYNVVRIFNGRFISPEGDLYVG